MPRLLLSFLAFFACVAAARAEKPNMEVRWDYLEHLSPEREKLRDIKIIDRTPLFANVPFLRLRPGDQLIRAATGPSGKDVMSGTVWIRYYLQTSGASYAVEAEEKEGGLQLKSGSLDPAFFFDWDVTAANADALYTLLYRRHLPPLTFAEWDRITAAVPQEFPAVTIAQWPLGYPSFSARNDRTLRPRLVTLPGQSYVVFSGVTYDDFTNEIYHFSVTIGPHVARITGRTLLQGPPHVRRDEFERDPPTASGNAMNMINMPGDFPLDPATAKTKKAEYDRMIAFQKVVADAIKSAATP